MTTRQLSVFGTLLGAIFFGLCAIFFAGIAVVSLIAVIEAGTAATIGIGLALALAAGFNSWLIGWCSWEEFREWRDDR